MKRIIPILSLWLCAIALGAGYISVSSAADTLSVSVLPGNPVATKDIDVQSSSHNTTVIVTKPEALHRSCITINTASTNELITLPGIGRVLADRIVTYRVEHGHFATYHDLDNVKGIGPATLKKLEGRLCFQ